MNIAIYGGSFDPVHTGHEAIINKISSFKEVDKLIVVPTFLNPFKSSFHFTPKQRFELLKELFKDDKKIEISDFEISKNTPTPSIETVDFYRLKYSPEKIFFVIGADNLEKLHLWHNFDILKDIVEFMVVTRRGYEVKNDIISFKKIDLNVDVSSSKLRDRLDLKYIPEKIVKKVIEYDGKNKENN